jgi:GT2 family glycosyltransferase
LTRSRRLYPQELSKITQAHQVNASAEQLTWSEQPTVTIVIVSLDRLQLTQRCLESIYAHTDYPFQLLIFDNGSQPDTVAYLKTMEAAHENLRVIYHPTNLGAAGGRNRAISLVDTQYAFCLDNDTICHPGWLRETMASAVRYKANFVVPMRLDMQNRVWGLGAELIRTENNTVLEIARWFYGLSVEMVQSLMAGGDFETNFVSGGVSLFAVDAFHNCAGFPAEYSSMEDIEFSLRLVDHGYTVWTAHRAMVTHDDEWLPQTDVEVRYACMRYNIDHLQQVAADFKAKRGVDVLPDKYVGSLHQRLQRKLNIKYE